MAGRRITRPAPETGPAAGPLPSEGAAPGGDDAQDGFDPERGPLRRCIVTRESLPKEAMLRFVLAPSEPGRPRAVVPDLAGRLPGRGMWLSARADVIERAASRGAFARAARGAVAPSPDLRARIEDALERRVRDLIGLARRAGQAVCGREAVREWLNAGRVAVLVEAADGSPAERERLVGARPVPVVTPLAAAELGAAFARDHAVHAAVSAGGLATAIVRESARLAGVRKPASGEDPAGRPERPSR